MTSYFRRVIGPAQGLRARLMRSGSGVTIVEILNRIVMLALSVILARGLGADGLGVYAFAMALITLLSLIAMAGMPPLLVREIAAYNIRKDWPLMKGLIQRSRHVVFIVSLCVATIGSLLVWFFGKGPETVQSQVLFLGFLLLVIEALRKLNSSALRGLRHIVIGKTLETLVRPLFAFSILLAFFIIRPDLLSPQVAMAAQLIAGMIGLVISYVLLVRASPSSLMNYLPDFKTKNWVIGALPFVMLGGVGFINKQTDILMLGVLATPEDVGIYRIVVALSGFTLFGNQIVATVIAPHISHLYEQNDMSRLQILAKRTALLTFFSSLPIAIIFVFFGDVLIEWVYGKEFVTGYLALAILACAELVRSMVGVPGIFLNMMRREKNNLRVSVVFAILNGILNIALIPKFGILGAAVSTGIVCVGQGGLLYMRLWSLSGIQSSPYVFKNVKK